MLPFAQHNPYAIAIKKYLLQMVPDKFNEQTSDVIDRSVNALVTKKDNERFMTLLGDIYQAGYGKGLEVAAEAVKSQGVHLEITKPKKR